MASRMRAARAAWYGRAGALMRLAWAASIVVCPAAATAQTSPSVTLRGIVFDSLVTSAPLRGAEVFLDGTPFRTTTDSLGRFTIDSLAPGTYEIGVGHVSLDSLGFASVRRRVVLREGVTTVRLGPPSDRTLFRQACTASADGADTGLLMGLVRRAADGAPAAGADVRAEWTISSLAFGRQGAITARPATVAARADTGGRYRLCGVPTDVAVVVTASVDSSVSGAVRVDLRGRFFAVQQLDVAPPAAGARAVLVAGDVRRTDGAPIPEAIVRVIGEARDTKTNAAGRYTLALSRAGTVTLEGRAIGFEPQRVVVTAREGIATPQSIALTPLAPQLEDLHVIADDIGFYRRRARGTQGIFITPEDIRRLKPERTEDAIRLLTKASFPAGFSVPQMELLRGGRCVPIIFIDGRPLDEVPVGSSPELPSATSTGLEALARPSSESPGKAYRYPLWMAPSDVRGIEVYDKLRGIPPELATQVLMDPYEFLQTVKCAVFIWTWRSVRATSAAE